MEEKMTLEIYKKEYLDDIHINAQIEGTTYDDYFFNDALSKLVSMGHFSDPQVLYVYKKCRNNRIMAFDAIAFDDSDKSIILIANDFSDSLVDRISKTEIDKICIKMLNFIQEAFDNQLELYFDTFDDIIGIGKNISKRMKIDYVDLEDDISIDKIKLYIVTNKTLSEKVHDLPSITYLGKKTDFSVWSVNRFFDLYQSGKDRESIVINVNKYGVDGIPCIKAEMTENLDYDAYLAIVPGEFLNKIYFDHGSKLLEGNVRAFLSNRGKINKGIRDTIRKEPTKFFTYNNGIACTASKVVLSEDNRYIKEIEDLQIINGGQTTASLTSAKLKDNFSLDNIFVPMKLTVVKDDDYDTIIQNISKYANSQNKVTDADLFSNHPFHRMFEILSKKVQAPPKDGSVHNTMWYYERSRGKYEQEQFKLMKKSERENFQRKYPKNQLIKKEDLAKYFNCADLMRPDVVSKGSQKSMSFFAEYIDNKYQYNKAIINEEFFRLCICYAILFRATDKIVNLADWYNVGGYKLNIVPYTISKLIYSIPKGYCLNYEKIWKNQETYPSLNYEIEKIAFITNEFIQKSDGVIVTEYCKKQDTWNKYKEIPYNFGKDFLFDLIKKDYFDAVIKDEIKSEKLNEDISIESEIINLGGEYWRNLIEEGVKRKILSPTELDLLNIAASSDSPKPKIATPKQAKLIWKIRDKLDKAGVLV